VLLGKKYKRERERERKRKKEREREREIEIDRNNAWHYHSEMSYVQLSIFFVSCLPIN